MAKELCLATILLVGGCGPAMPSELPPESPASDQASAAPRPALATALKGDPDPSWPGLAEAGAPMHHHGTEPGHAQ
jgi:hypothetical protein